MKTTYATLLSFTDQGARNIKDSVNRAKAFREKAESAGVKVLSQLWTAGSYDGLMVLEGDSEEKLLGLLAQLSASGNVRTHSLRAFGADEFARVVGT
jgi:uncharacterized protein with GYD domain